MAISHPIVRAAGPAQFGSVARLSRRRYWFDRLSAGLDDKGMQIAWSHRFAVSSVIARWAPLFFKRGPHATLRSLYAEP